MVTKRLIAPVLAGLLLVGCTAPAPVPVPTLTPSPVCTPEAGGAEYPCTQAEFEKMKARDALYAEAEEVNRQFRDLLEVIYRGTVTQENSDPLLALTAGSGRKDALDLLEELSQDEAVMVGGDFRYTVSRRVGASKEGSEVSLRVCSDGSSLTVKHPDGDEWPGAVVVDLLYFKRVDGQMKIWATDEEEAETCE